MVLFVHYKSKITCEYFTRFRPVGMPFGRPQLASEGDYDAEARHGGTGEFHNRLS